VIDTRAPRRRLSYFRHLQLSALLFVLPAFIILGLFRIAPIVMSARLSAFNFHLLTGNSRFINFDNYIEAAQDKQLLASLKTTAIFVAVKLPLQLAISLGLAMVVNRPGRGVALVRSAPLMAVVMPLSISSVLWRMMYHPSNGIFNSLLQTVGLPPQPFLVDPGQALPAIVALSLWSDVGFYMIIYLAGLQGIPEEFYDAARVDGASPWSEFWHITWPLLSRTTVVVLILSTVLSFQVFIPVYVMTEGGPRGATEVVGFYMYRIAFRLMRMGYANAISMITLVILSIISLIQLRASRPQH
jgi:ABC-type sugar transport system permease subunit